MLASRSVYTHPPRLHLREYMGYVVVVVVAESDQPSNFLQVRPVVETEYENLLLSLYIVGVANHTKEESLEELGYLVGVLPYIY